MDGGNGNSLDAIRHALKLSEGRLSWIITFSAQLARTFDIVNQLEGLSEQFSGYVADVCYLDKADSMPLLIKLANFGKLDFDDERNEALKLIEHILFKLTFTTGWFRTNNLVSIARAYDGTNYDTYLLPRLRHDEQHGFQEYWDFNGCCLRYFTDNRYHYTRELKYVLYKYENYLRSNRKERKLSIDACQGVFSGNKSVENTLDHIAPQTPDFTDYTDVFRNDYLSNIGNLSLLSWSGNAAKSNHDPTLPTERERYNTVSWSQKEIYAALCAGKWGEKEIDERRKRIVEFIKSNWWLVKVGSHE